MIGSSIGPYRIVGKLGEGGMGEVFKAIHDKIERRVAIKLLRPRHAGNAESLTRFYHEAVAVNLIGHPGVIQVHDYVQLEDGSTYLVMEYLDGTTLSARLKQRQSPMSEYEAVSVSFQLASALAAAHEVGIVHRDLKPGNIMIVPDPAMLEGERVKLLDFGIAKLEQGLMDEGQRRTRSGILMGTPRYMSPEQCRGLSDLDGKADVYSLGVLLYQLLVGRPPFIGRSDIDVIASHLTEPPVPLTRHLPTLSAPLSTLVHRMLEKEKEDRPNMREVAIALKRFRDERWTNADISFPADTLIAGSDPLPAAAQASPLAPQQERSEPAENPDPVPVKPAIVQVPSSAILARPTKLMKPPLLVPPPNLLPDAEQGDPAAPAVPAESAAAPSSATPEIPDSSTVTAPARRRLLYGGAVLSVCALAVGAGWFLSGPLRQEVPVPVRAPAEPAQAPELPQTAEPAETPRPSAAAPPAELRPAATEDAAAVPVLRLPASASALSPGCEVKLKKAMELKNQRAYGRAVKSLQADLEVCKDPRFLRELGNASFLAGDYGDARRYYQSILSERFESGSVPADEVNRLIKLVDACTAQRQTVEDSLRDGKFENIVDDVEKAAQTCSNEGLFFKFGISVDSANQYKEAIALYDKYLLTNPPDVLAQKALGAKKTAQTKLEALQKKATPTGLRDPFAKVVPSPSR